MSKLIAPERTGTVTLEETIARRRSVREFSQMALSDDQISRLLWAAQGITDNARKLRAAPSAGAIYPIELYAVAADGISRYLPADHTLERVKEGDFRPQLAAAAFGQDYLAAAPLTVVIVAEYGKIEDHYGERARRYTDMEAGHIAQNLHLEACALGLGSVPVGAFSDSEVKSLLALSGNLEPIYMVPIGYPKK